MSLALAAAALAGPDAESQRAFAGGLRLPGPELQPG